MSLIKNNGSLLERDFENFLQKSGIKYRKQTKALPGRPDFVIQNKKIVVFIDSCFWHGCRYHGSLPKSNRRFWSRKILRNKERDREVGKEYEKIDWLVIRLWEHNFMKSAKRAIAVIKRS